MWQATVGRSLSLADFAWKGLGQRSLGKLARAANLHEAMLLASLKVAAKVAAIASDREALLFTCSTPDEEVGLVWTADAAKTSTRAARARALR